MENIKTNFFFMLTIFAVSIASVVNVGCEDDGVPPNPDPTACVWFTGGAFCTPPWEVGNPVFDGTIVVTDGTGATTSSTPITVSADDVFTGQFRDGSGNNILNTNCISVVIPATGAFNVTVTLTSRACLTCCPCFGEGGIATITGTTMLTSDPGIPIEVILNHDPIAGCPFEDCCQ